MIEVYDSRIKTYHRQTFCHYLMSYIEREAAEERAFLESDPYLIDSDSSQVQVAGCSSSDEDLLDGDYESDFIDDDTTDDSSSISETPEFYIPGLPRFVNSQLPQSSLLFVLNQKLDELYTMPPKTKNGKNKVPLKFEEKLANQRLVTVQSDEEEETANRIETKVDRLVTEQLENRRAKQKLLRQPTATTTQTAKKKKQTAATATADDSVDGNSENDDEVAKLILDQPKKPKSKRFKIQGLLH